MNKLFYPPYQKSGLIARFFFISAVFYVIAQGILLLFLSIKTNGQFENIDIVFLAKNYPVFFKILQIIQSLTIFFIPAIIFPFFAGNTFSNFYPLKKIKISTIIIIFLFITISIPFVNSLIQLNKILPLKEEIMLYFQEQQNSADNLIKILLNTNKSISGFFLNTITIAFIPAISEEIFFRGALQKILEKNIKNIHFAIIITALIFSFIHFQFLTFLPRFYLGIILGYLFYWSNNLLIPILAHFINNFFGVFSNHFLSIDLQNKIDKIGSDISVFPIILTFALISITFYLVKKHFEYAYKQQK